MKIRRAKTYDWARIYLGSDETDRGDSHDPVLTCFRNMTRVFLTSLTSKRDIFCKKGMRCILQACCAAKKPKGEDETDVKPKS